MKKMIFSVLLCLVSVGAFANSSVKLSCPFPSGIIEATNNGSQSRPILNQVEPFIVSPFNMYAPHAAVTCGFFAGTSLDIIHQPLEVGKLCAEVKAAIEKRLGGAASLDSWHCALYMRGERNDDYEPGLRFFFNIKWK